ncbi:hypothetical protein ABID14_001692 [Peptoniphilus olsenii]|uniref:Uncharacterized protein n=1 Tax=Peptoniphilus olsenii TaxID=411570 RepID=A0ABV2JB90_9FIRM
MKKFLRIVLIFVAVVIFMNVFNISVFVGRKKIDRYFVMEQFEKINGKEIVDKAKNVGGGVKSKVNKMIESTR